MLSSIVNIGHRYLVPRRSGRILVGSCEEEVGHQHGTTPDKLNELRSFARQVCPELRQSRETDSWSGLRPMTFDAFPLIGKVPGSQRVFVASGHFRSGIHLSAGTARCVADLMCGREPPLPTEAFRVGKQQQQLDPN